MTRRQLISSLYTLLVWVHNYHCRCQTFSPTTSMTPTLSSIAPTRIASFISYLGSKDNFFPWLNLTQHDCNSALHNAILYDPRCINISNHQVTSHKPQYNTIHNNHNAYSMFPFYTLFSYYNLLTYISESLYYDRGFDLQEFMSHKPNKKKIFRNPSHQLWKKTQV